MAFFQCYRHNNLRDACRDFMDANSFHCLLKKLPDVENFLESLMVVAEECRRKEQRGLIHYSVLFQNDT